MNKPTNILDHIALLQMEVVPGQPWQNLQTALSLVQQAKDQGFSLLVLPEHCLSGYLVGDLWEETAFVKDCESAGAQLAQASQGCVIVFGNVASDPSICGEDGRMRLYNAAYVASQGVFLSNSYTGFSFIPKTLLPNYRAFEESRHFFDLRKLARERRVELESLYGVHPVEIQGQTYRLGVLLCEDGWGQDYHESLVEELARQNADLILNLSASPYTRQKNSKRNRVFSAQASQFQIPIAYVNCMGSQNNGKTFYGFDGCSTLYSSQGSILAEAPAWESCVLHAQSGVAPSEIVSQSSGVSPWAGAHSEFEPADCHTLCQVIRRYLQSAGLSRVVIGVSGGVDSAVAAALFTHICGPSQVLLVSMPSLYNSGTTRGLAADLAQRLGCWFVEVPIQESVQWTHSQIHGLVAQGAQGASLTLQLSDFHMENVQARDRSSRILAALACAFGGVFTCNANKSEITVGYSTLYGDHGGFMAPLADLWKSEIYALGQYLNQVVFGREVIPQGVFTLKPSAELNPHQNPEQGGGDPILYSYHDCLFRALMQSWNRVGPEEILMWYSQGELQNRLGLPHPINHWFPDASRFIQDLERWWKLFKGMGVVKRVQSPPLVALSRRAFGYDYRESILPVWWSQRYLELKDALLGATH